MSAPYYGVPVELLRSRIGLLPTDASRDAEIEEAFTDGVLSINDYLDRVLQLGDYKEVSTHFRGFKLSLPAYPVETVATVFADEIEPSFHLDKVTGLIKFDSVVGAHTLTVEYKGGYDIFPDAIQIAAIDAFDNAWRFLNSTSVAASSTSVVKSVSIDGMRVDYFDSSSESSVSESMGYLSPTTVSTLEPYRRVFA